MAPLRGGVGQERREPAQREGGDEQGGPHPGLGPHTDTLAATRTPPAISNRPLSGALEDGPFPLGPLGEGVGGGVVRLLAGHRWGGEIAEHMGRHAGGITTVGGLPGLFVDIPAALKVATAAATLLAVSAVVLMFSRDRRPETAA